MIKNKQTLVTILVILFLHIVVNAQTKTSYKPVGRTKLDKWIKLAKEKREVDTSKLQVLEDEYENVLEQPDNLNAVYDYARILTIVLQPGLNYAIEKKLSASVKYLVEESEKV